MRHNCDGQEEVSFSLFFQGERGARSTHKVVDGGRADCVDKLDEQLDGKDDDQ